jgi:hypothetical protein
METELDSTDIPDISQSITAAVFSEHSLYPRTSTLSAGSLSGSAQRELMNYKCKVCGYDQMPDPPIRHNICPCCGTEYGLDDDDCSYEELRDAWLRAGAPWFSSLEPYVPALNWNAWDQLDLAGYSYSVPRPESAVSTRFVTVPAWSGHMIRPDERPRWVH